VSRLLIIEDDASVAKLLQKHFEKLGFLTVWQGSGEDALAWVKQGDVVDIDVCDLGLPGMNGAHVVEELRTDPATAKIPIIVCSGRTSMQDHALALEAGADLFVEKPMRMKHLEDEVRRLLSPRE
jgi:DNA-binding response OmpR family regulator